MQKQTAARTRMLRRNVMSYPPFARCADACGRGQRPAGEATDLLEAGGIPARALLVVGDGEP
jgi:hypothetical protein